MRRGRGKERAPAPDAVDDAVQARSIATQDSRRLGGVKRMAQPKAAADRLAGSRAAAEKRTANAMTPEERLEKRAADKRRRLADRKAAQAAEGVDSEAVAAIEAADREADEALEDELEDELNARIIEQHGEPSLDDTHTRETVELELRMEGFGADRSDDGRQVYTLPHGELQRRMADGEMNLPGEGQISWDRRVLLDRLARGAALGPYLEQLQCLLSEPSHDPIAGHELANHGSKPGDWQPQGAEPAPPPPPPPSTAQEGPAQPSASGCSSLVMALDEGDVPYFYAPDTSRTLAAKHERLDSSVANPEWMSDPPAESAAPEALPPERSDYDLGEPGQRAYRRDRSQWYRDHTGGELGGSIAEQNEQWDNYKRNFRARSTQAEPEWDPEFAEYARDCGF